MTRLYAVDTPLPAARPRSPSPGRGVGASPPAGRLRPGHDGFRLRRCAPPKALPARSARSAAPARPGPPGRRPCIRRGFPRRPCRSATAPWRSSSGRMVPFWFGHGHRKGMLGGMTEFVGSAWTAEPLDEPGLPGALIDVVRRGQGRARLHAFRVAARGLYGAPRRRCRTGAVTGGRRPKTWRGSPYRRSSPRSGQRLEAARQLSSRSTTRLASGLVGFEGADQQRGRKREDRKA